MGQDQKAMTMKIEGRAVEETEDCPICLGREASLADGSLTDNPFRSDHLEDQVTDHDLWNHGFALGEMEKELG